MYEISGYNDLIAIVRQCEERSTSKNISMSRFEKSQTQSVKLAVEPSSALLRTSMLSDYNLDEEMLI